MRRGRILLAVFVIAVIGIVWLILGTHRTPDGQQPLTEIRSLGAFQQAFNAGSQRTRIVLLLSPT